MSEWINVEDRLPQEGIDVEDQVDDVLVLFSLCCKECLNLSELLHYGIGYYDGKAWNLTEHFDHHSYPNDYEETIKITHWMLLPKQPI